MAFFGNKRKDFSIQPPKQQVDGTPFYVTDSANIDFTLLNLNLTANLTQLLPTSGTYGDATHIPVLQIDQWGRVTGVTTVAIGGGGGTYTVNNGLSPDPLDANNFQLGGTLIKSTTIDTASYLMTFTGNRFNFPIVYVENIAATGSGLAVKSNNVSIQLISNNSSLNTVQTSMELVRLAPGVVSNGIGQSILFKNQTLSGSNYEANRIISEITNVAPGNFTSKMILTGTLNNTPKDILTLLGTGQLQLNQYTGTTFDASPTKSLGVDSSGNVITFTGSGGPAAWGSITGTLTSQTDLITYLSTNYQPIGSYQPQLNGTGFVKASGTTISYDNSTYYLASNPSNFITSAALTPYLLSSVAATTYYPLTGNPSGFLTTAVTSVGLSMPSAFTVTVSPITSTGSLTVVGAGTTSQYVRGDGTLATYNPGTGGGGASVSYYLNGSISQTPVISGVTYRQMSKTPVIGVGTDFTINADGYIQSFITDAGTPNQLLIPAGNWNFEMYFSASSSGGSPSFYVQIYKWDGTTLTLIADNSATPEAITGGTAIDLYTTAVAMPSTVLLATDRIAIRVFVTHSGRTITLHTEDSHLCQVITTFSTGITALNGLTDQVQYFVTPGTSGTAPNWNSVSPNHTLNIPLASTASVTAGLISNTNFNTFNGKQDTLTATKSVEINTGNIELDGDLASPGNNKVYGTDASGVRGWKADPTGGGNSIGELTSDVTAGPASSPSQSVAATLAASYKKGSCSVVFDGAGGVITSGTTAYAQVPYNGTIASWTIVSSVSGSCTVTVFKDTYANFPPIISTDNVFTVQPALATQVKNQNLSPTFLGSQATVTAGDWIGFTISGITTATWVNLTLSITKTV